MAIILQELQNCTVANVMKLLTAVSYDFSKQAKVFVPVNPFQPSLTFVGEARSLH